MKKKRNWFTAEKLIILPDGNSLMCLVFGKRSAYIISNNPFVMYHNEIGVLVEGKIIINKVGSEYYVDLHVLNEKEDYFCNYYYGMKMERVTKKQLVSKVTEIFL